MIRIGIVDYEAKQIDKIPLWYEQQTEILKCFEEDHGMIKKCISIVSYKQNHNNKEDIITDSLCDKLLRFFTSVTHFFHKKDSPESGEYTSIRENSPSTSLAPNNLQ